MKKYLVLLLALFVSAVSFNSYAFTVPPKPTNNSYVLDQTGKLSSDQIDKLNNKIDALNKSTKNEYAIVLLKTLDGANIEDAAQDTFRSWGVGKANLNNGVMIMVALAERKTRIQTGKGVEGDLPDLLCNDILNQKLKPLLKKGNFYDGFDVTLDAIVSHMESREKEKAVVAAPKEVPNAVAVNSTQSAISDYTNAGIFFLVLLGFGIVGFVVFLVIRNASKKRELAYEMRRIELEDNWRASNLAAAKRQDEQRRHKAAVKPKYASSLIEEDYSNKHSSIKTSVVVDTAVVTSAAVVAVNDEIMQAKRRQAEKEVSERAARQRREEESRRRDEESSRSSYSSSYSSTSYDSGSSSGSFGGGDSGGGGSSGDF